MNEVSSQITASAVVVWLIQQLKQSGRFPWMNNCTDLLNRTIAIVLATASAAGITMAYSWGGSSLTITLDGLTAANAMAFLWKVVNSVALQELIYRGAVKSR